MDTQSSGLLTSGKVSARLTRRWCGVAQGPQMVHAGEAREWAPGDRRGGTLVVCPTSVLRQWEREIVAKVARGAGPGPSVP